jgi:nicotinamidase-related amidase
MSMTGRIWEPFLTEQDRAHLARTPDRRVGFGSRPALLLIDLYRWVFGDRPRPLLEAIEDWPGSCGLAAWDALPAIQRLIGACREFGLPVVHMTGLDGAGMPGWSEASHSGIGRGGVASAAAVPSERRKHRYDIIDEVAPIDGEVVLRKTTPSAFNGTPLVHHLVSQGVDTLIVAGESTSGCVRASVVDGCSYRFRMIVVEECVFDRHEATHAINLFDMHTKYADVLSLSEVEAHLRATTRTNGEATRRHVAAST